MIIELKISEHTVHRLTTDNLEEGVDHLKTMYAHLLEDHPWSISIVEYSTMGQVDYRILRTLKKVS